MKAKKLVAIVLTATMILGSNVIAFADVDNSDPKTGSVNGSGISTGHVDRTIINCVFPTITAGTNDGYFNFVMDPEGLIAETSTYKGNAITADAATKAAGVYFETDTANTYSNKSQEYEVINKSSVSLNIIAEANTVSADKVTLAENAESVSGNGVVLYLGLKVGDETTAIKDGKVSASANVEGYADNFEVDSKADGSFEYVLKASPDESKWSKTKISMEGAVNKVDDASSVTYAPEVEVTWKYEKAGESSSYADVASVSSANNVITLSLPDGVTVSSIVLTKADSSTANMTAGKHYNVSGSKYTFVASNLTNWSGGKLTFTYSDGNSDEISIQ